MKSRFIIFNFFLLSSFFINAQSNKHLLEVGMSGGIGPGFVSNSFNSNLLIRKSANDNGVVDQPQRYNGYLNFEYTYLTSNRFGLSARLYYQNMKIPVQEYYSYQLNSGSWDYSNNEFTYESPSFTSIGAMFLMKFTPKESILPFGLEYSFGGGPRFYKMVNKEYYGEYTDSTGQRISGVIPQQINTDLENQRYRGVDFLLGLGLNFPITQSQFISVAIDFTGSFVIRSSYEGDTNEYDSEILEERIEQLYYDRNYAQEINVRVLYSIGALRVGYKISF
jgi:hypothetical protein